MSIRITDALRDMDLSTDHTVTFASIQRDILAIQKNVSDLAVRVSHLEIRSDTCDQQISGHESMLSTIIEEIEDIYQLFEDE